MLTGANIERKSRCGNPSFQLSHTNLRFVAIFLRVHCVRRGLNTANDDSLFKKPFSVQVTSVGFKARVWPQSPMKSLAKVTHKPQIG